MIAHHGYFKDVSVVIDAFPLCSLSHATFLRFEVDHLFSGQSVLWDKRANACPLFLNQKIVVMHWSEPKSYNKPFVLLYSHDFNFRGQ